jgi:tetratricopeptide (TPR) repeat protein
MLGDWHAKQGLRQEAASYYLKTLELDLADTEAASNLGACLADGGHREQALALLGKVVELDPRERGCVVEPGSGHEEPR